ncbi:MAG: Rieske 2Fe-2S domain-containing protein [Sulfurifustaceae bacterium]
MESTNAVKYLRNCWYVAAWDYEVTRTMFARDILGESILLYRKEDGTPVAMSNVCPHRFAPLHKGKLIGDVVECPYHGLQFDCTGQCVKNPHPGGNGPIPTRAKVPSYPVLEKWGAIWIWMGHKTPDLSMLPDFSWLDRPQEWRAVRDVLVVNAHYELIMDNVMDLTHLSYVHPGGLGSGPENVANEVVEDVQEGTTFWCKRSTKNIMASPDMQAVNPILKTIRCDKNNNTRWDAPGHMAILVNYRKTGTVDEHKTGLSIAFMLTPASDGKTHHFWSIARNFHVDSKEVDAMIRHEAEVGLVKQDTGIIEAQYKQMGTPDITKLDLVALIGDVTPTRVRRYLRKRIEDEQRELQELAARGAAVRHAEPAVETA